MVSDGLNWSTESMRNSAEAWSLADDVCLRVFLESFGAKLDENLRQVLDSLGKLEDRIEASSINLGNVTNRLGLLSSTQFVESRVAEDDDTSHLIKDETKESSEDPNSDKLFCEKVGKALSFGNAFIESAFVTVDFEESDSEDDDVLQDLEPAYESKSIYHLRKLPHVIGTQNFLTEANIGMGSSSDEKEEPSALSESEESENELDVAPKLENFAEQVSDYSISDQDSDVETSTQKSNQQASSKFQDTDILKPASSDLGSIFKDDSKTVKDVSDSPLAPKKSFADELASKIRTTEPPAQVGNKKTIKSIFSSDSDEDDGLFSSRYDPLAKGSNKIPSTLLSSDAKPSTSPLPRSKPIENKFEAQLPANEEQYQPDKKGESSPPQISNSIISSDSVSDNDNRSLVTIVPASAKVGPYMNQGSERDQEKKDPVKQPLPKAEKKSKSTKLFESDSDDDELFTPRGKNAPITRSIIPNTKELSFQQKAVSTTQTSSSKDFSLIKKQSIFDDSSSEDEMDALFKTVSRPTRSNLASTPEKKNKNTNNEVKSAPNLSIFSDTDDDLNSSSDIQVNSKRSNIDDLPTHSTLPDNPSVEPHFDSSANKSSSKDLVDQFGGQKVIHGSVESNPQSLNDFVGEDPATHNTSGQESSTNDDVDGNVMSGKSAQFKDILNAKMAKGPKLFGKRKKSVNLATVDTSATSSESLDPGPKFIHSQQNIRSNEVITPLKMSASDSNLKLLEPHQPIDSEDSIITEKEVEVLKSLTKTRAGRPNNRRGPTRKPRKNRDTPDGQRSFTESKTETSEYEDSSRNSSFQAQSVFGSMVSEDEALRRRDDLSSSLQNLEAESTKPQTSKQPHLSPKAESDNDDDIFGPPPMPETIKSARDPLFGTPSSDEDDLFGNASEPKVKKLATASSLFDDLGSDDDLFA